MNILRMPIEKIARGLPQNLAQLADDDQQFMEGKEDELFGFGRIQKRTGKAKIGITGTLPVVGECCAVKTNECSDGEETCRWLIQNTNRGFSPPFFA